MRYAADEKLEIIRFVENSHLGVKRTLDKLGVARPTFYRWYARYQTRGEAGLNNHYRGPARPWNRLPEEVRARLIELALEEPELSPHAMAMPCNLKLFNSVGISRFILSLNNVWLT
jgi:transposase